MCDLWTHSQPKVPDMRNLQSIECLNPIFGLSGPRPDSQSSHTAPRSSWNSRPSQSRSSHRARTLMVQHEDQAHLHPSSVFWHIPFAPCASHSSKCDQLMLPSSKINNPKRKSKKQHHMFACAVFLLFVNRVGGEASKGIY